MRLVVVAAIVEVVVWIVITETLVVAVVVTLTMVSVLKAVAVLYYKNLEGLFLVRSSLRKMVEVDSSSYKGLCLSSDAAKCQWTSSQSDCRA